MMCLHLLNDFMICMMFKCVYDLFVNYKDLHDSFSKIGCRLILFMP